MLLCDFYCVENVISQTSLQSKEKKHLFIQIQTDFIQWLHTKREDDYFLLTRALYMLRLTSADDWQLLPTIHQHWSQNIDNAIIQILKEFLYWQYTNVNLRLWNYFDTMVHHQNWPHSVPHDSHDMV